MKHTHETKASLSSFSSTANLRVQQQPVPHQILGLEEGMQLVLQEVHHHWPQFLAVLFDASNSVASFFEHTRGNLCAVR